MKVTVAEGAMGQRSSMAQRWKQERAPSEGRPYELASFSLIHCVFWAPTHCFSFGTRCPSCNKLGEKHPTTLLMSVRLARIMHSATEQRAR